MIQPNLSQRCRHTRPETSRAKATYGSAPPRYFFRPYLVYRSRSPHQVAERAERPGWERVGS